VGAQRAATQRCEEPREIRLDATNLLRFLAAGRLLRNATIVADAEVPTGVRLSFQSVGWEWVARERGRLTGTEQANDEALLNRIYEGVAGRSAATIVLATGDGAGSHDGHGFIPALDFAVRYGWRTEVASWRESFNRTLCERVQQQGGVALILDQWYDSLTAWPPLRRSEPVFLTRRPLAA
jgi:hypothetical protein